MNNYAGDVAANWPQPQKNKLGLAAFIVGVIGAILGVIKGTIFLGWILLPVAFILGLIALFLKNKKKGFAIAAVVIGFVAPIISGIVFIGYVGEAVHDAVKEQTGVTTAAPGATAGNQADKPANAAGKTRENPLPIGSEIKSKDWKVVINSVKFKADSAVANADRFNIAAKPGQEYILVNASVTYIGEKADGGHPDMDVRFEYVGPDGKGNDWTSAITVKAPEELDKRGTLYKDATAKGNIVLSIPTESSGQGVIAVTPGLFSEKVFVNVK